MDLFAADGYDLLLAGHTHGGQLRVPGYGALTTNCGIDRKRAVHTLVDKRKIVLMATPTGGNTAPAATATKPAIRAYSMRSWPRVSRHRWNL